MKTFTLIAILLTVGLGLTAQPVFEKIINESANICYLESTGEVYYSMDVVNKQCHIYKMDHSLVYSLPDSVVQTKAASFQTLDFGEPFPNPASRQISIPVTLPEGESTGTIDLFDMNGQRKLSYPVTGSEQHIILPTHSLVAGTYVYHINSGKFRSPAKKIVVRN